MDFLSMLHEVPPAGSLEAAHLQKIMDMDVAFQVKLRALQRRLPHLLNARLKNGSGLQMSKLLRGYFLEYFDRYFKHGPGSFPSSFNVVEAFLFFDRENRFFDLREEKEHLLSIDDYFRWYEKGEIQKKPEILQEIMEEGVIYSYDMMSGEGSPRISGDSHQVFAGISFVRHAHELSCLLLAGESPPQTSDEEVARRIKEGFGITRNGILPASNLTAKDRYLDGFPNFAKLIVMTRFDVRAEKHDVRYVNLDLGPSFTVFTDDFSIFSDVPEKEIQRLRQMAVSGLQRYDDVFAALSAMIFLPAFSAAFPEDIHDLNVSTTLGAMQDDKSVQEIARELGDAQCPLHRNIKCFPVKVADGGAPRQQIDPPEMKFKTDGYWRTIGPQEIGEGKKGEKVFGRTWVSRHESWSARSPQSFILERNTTEPLGPDAGIVYVQRSPGHGIDLYKVGLTRRSADVRAGELSSATGVPLPFGVLASWSVGNCATVEREVHERLAAYRINPRREFFRAELSHIVRTIEAVIRDTSMPRA